MLKKIILVFKTHFDFGFTNLSEKVLEQYTGSMLRDVINACVNTADLDAMRFVFTLPAWPLQAMIDSGVEKETLNRLIENGQVVWHALPFTPHTDFASIEDTISSFQYARRLSAHFNKPLAASAKMTDVPGHGWYVPTVFSGAGIKFLHIGCNEYPKAPKVPRLFFWESPDGARLLTMYYPDGYGDSTLFPEDWDFPVWMAMMHTHDNDGPQSPDDIRQIVEEAKKKHPGVEIVSGTLDDFYHELAQCDLSALPVVKADLADTWIHGVGTYPREVQLVRDARHTVTATQKTLALLGSGNAAQIEQDIARAYDNLAMFDEHTWGLDVKTWMNHERVYEKSAFAAAKQTEEYRYMERSWEEQKNRANEAHRFGNAAFGAVQGGGSAGVLNPNGSAFSGWAAVEGGAADISPANCRTIYGKPHVYVTGAPPLAITSLSEVTSPLPATKLAYSKTPEFSLVENHRYSMRFNEETGVVLEVFDKKQNATLLKATGDAGVFSYRYDVYGDADVQNYLDELCSIDSDWGVKDNGRLNYPPTKRATFTPQFTGFRLQEDQVVFTYSGTGTEAYGDAKHIELSVTLPPCGDEIFVELKLEDKQETPYVESGSFVLPLGCQTPEYRLNKNGVVLNPKTDIVENANHALYCLEAFAAPYCSQTGKGVCVVSKDTPLMAIGETAILRFRGQYEEHKPQLFFNLFNNMWGTNFPQWIGGTYTFRYTLFGAQEDENVMLRALSLYSGAKVAELPPAHCPVHLPPQVQVSCLKPLNGGTLLRLRDTSGQARSITLQAATPGKTLQKTDLQDNPAGDAIPNEITLPLGQYGIATVLLK